MPPHTPTLRTIPISTASRSYECVIGPDLLSSAAARIRAALPDTRSIHIFTDANLPAALAADLTRHLTTAGSTGGSPFRVSSSPVHPSEEGKTLQTLYHMLQQLAAHNLERRDAVLALGGGIVGDMAGFAAASYRRGIPWINCPTTLLSMVDASVGGKTGVNLWAGCRGGVALDSATRGAPRVADAKPSTTAPQVKSTTAPQLLKNMIGAFWQPALVLADVSTLASLDERTFRAGLAECFKHAMLSADWGDEHLMLWTKEHLAAILEREPAALTELIARNVAIKAKVVGTDEREESTDPAQHGGRAALNLGHTFGHAIETLPMVSPSPDASLAPLHHGEAVALGLICAARCAELLKLVGDGLTESLRLTLGHAGLPTAAHHLPGSSEIYERMGHDKKAAAGKMRLVLPCGEAKCKVVVSPPEELVLQAIDAIRP